MSKAGYAKLDRSKLHSKVLKMSKRIGNTQHELWKMTTVMTGHALLTPKEKAALNKAQALFSVLGEPYKALEEVTAAIREAM